MLDHFFRLVRHAGAIQNLAIFIANQRTIHHTVWRIDRQLVYTCANSMRRTAGRKRQPSSLFRKYCNARKFSAGICFESSSSVPSISQAQQHTLKLFHCIRSNLSRTSVKYCGSDAENSIRSPVFGCVSVSFAACRH